MNATNTMLSQYLQTGRVFTVPVYQRTYDWREEQCKRLFDDMIALYGDNTKRHFIGTICVKWNVDAYDIVVVDGQQRITTTMLMYLALLDLADDERLKRQLLGYYLINEYDDGDDRHYRLVSVERDFAVWKKLIAHAEEDIPLDLTDDERETRIWKNYELFHSRIEEVLSLGYTCQGIKEAIDRLEIVSLALTDENPQVIFESLNSTGLDLSVIDLIRNYFLMNLSYSKQKRMYKKYWAPMEKLLGDMMERFFVDYMMVKERKHVYDPIKAQSGSKGISITSKALYSIIKDKYPHRETTPSWDIEKLLADLLKYAEYYTHIAKPQLSDDDVNRLSDADKTMYQIEHRIPSGSASVFLLHAYAAYDEGLMTQAQHASICKAVLSYCVRSRICELTGLNAQRAALALRHFDDYDFKADPVGTVWSILDDGKGKFRFPDDKEFSECLADIPMYTWLRAKGTYYILYSIESHCKGAKELPAYSSSTSIEHVFPQSPNDDWIAYANANSFNSYEEQLHTMGNLTLTGYNSELGRKSFDEKKQAYRNSSYVITRNIASYSTWDEAAIHRRASQMAKIACHVWPKRQGAAKRVLAEGREYALATDETEFANKKLVYAVFDGETIEATTWKSLVLKIAGCLYACDSEVFRELLNNPSIRSGVIIAADSDGNFPDGTKQLDEHVGMFIHCGAQEIIRILRSMCQHYDLRLGTDFYDNLTICVMDK